MSKTMLTAIKSLFNQHIQLEEQLFEKSDPVPLAVCALLLEMAHADDEFTDDELDSIIAVLKEQFGLSPEEADKLIELADKERKESIDLWQFSNLIHDNCDYDEKMRIIETMWSVVYADGILDAHEDYLMHKLAAVLDLNHRELIEAKINTKEN